MKKYFTSLFLVLTLCLTVLPVKSVLAEDAQSSNTSITSVDELMKFAEAVNAGEYDEKTDAVVTLDADLDLSGVAWIPIGRDHNGDVEHCFSGKFYGNGHTISNLEYSSFYGKTEYMLSGLFGYIEDAEISDLTVKGTINMAEAGDYTYFGTIAGYAVGADISNCVSDVSVQNNGNYMYGFLGMVGYAQDTTIEYCQNKGSFNITGDMGSLYAGGIVGYTTGTSEVKYCANTGDMIYGASHGGGVVGALSGSSKLTNCYSTGKLTPLGRGIADVGGIVGTVNSNTTVSHCYFAGEIDLSQYTATPNEETLQYGRLGSIAGAGSATFENNYFTEKENVAACGRNAAAGTAKTLDDMKTEAFYREITAGGGNYRYNAGGTPLLPNPKYTVTFTITPADLTNVVVKVNGQELTANTIDLEAGTYTVEVTADNCEAFSQEITVTADVATHTQTLALTYLSADYSKVDAAIAKADALNKDQYQDFSAVEAAVNAVVRDKKITEQADVDAMAKAIEDAIAGLKYKDADYSKVDAAIKKANALKKEDYKDFSAVEKAVKAVIRGKNITEQEEVDKMAKAIEDAINALEKKASGQGTDKNVVKTGDRVNPELWMVLLLISGGAVAVAVGKKKSVR